MSPSRSSQATRSSVVSRSPNAASTSSLVDHGAECDEVVGRRRRCPLRHDDQVRPARRIAGGDDDPAPVRQQEPPVGAGLAGRGAAASDPVRIGVGEERAGGTEAVARSGAGRAWHRPGPFDEAAGVSADAVDQRPVHAVTPAVEQVQAVLHVSRPAGRWTTSQVTLGEDRGQLGGVVDPSGPHTGEHQPREPRVGAERHRRPTVVGEARIAVEQTEVGQQRTGDGPRRRRGRVEPPLVGHRPPRRQGEHEVGQIGLPDLRLGLGGEAAVLGLGPQADAETRAEAAGAPARWSADERDTATVASRARPRRRSARGTRARPASTTARTLGTVRLDSATAEDRTTRRCPSDLAAGSRTRRCSASGIVPWSSATSADVRRSARTDATRRISPRPGRNTSTSPSPVARRRVPIASATSAVRARGSFVNRAIGGDVDGSAQSMVTGWTRPGARSTGAPPSRFATGPASRVADIARTRRPASRRRRDRW